MVTAASTEASSLEVAVIIPAYNEEEVIRDCLDGLVAQTYSHFKAFIIDDASLDSTADIVREYQKLNPKRIELLQFGKVGPGRARNLVAAQVQSHFVVFTDADCNPSQDWLQELMKSFSDEKIGSAGGPQKAMPNSNPFQKRLEKFFSRLHPFIDFYKAASAEEIDTLHNPLCNVAYRRDLFLKLKGFREDLFPGEDVELDFRICDAGFRIRYNPRAIVYHHRPENIQQFRKVMHAYGKAQGRLVREYGLRRKIQILATLILFVLTINLLSAVAIMNLTYLAASLLFYLALFFLRPNGEGYFSILLNAAHWLNGFIAGLRVPPYSPAAAN